MDFELTRENLDRLSKQEGCAPEDFLNIIYDFWKETGETIASVPANDVERLLDILPWAGQLIKNIATQNKPQIMGNNQISDSRKNRLNELTGELESISKQVEYENEVCQKIKESEQEYIRKKGELSGIKEEEQIIRDSCGKLIKEIEQLSNVDIKTAKEEEERLRNRKNELEKELENARIKNKGICENISCLKEMFTKSENQRDTLDKQAKELDIKVNSIRREINDKTDSLRRAEDLKNEYMNQKKELDMLVSKANTECAKINNEIQGLDKTLKGKDFANQIQILQDMRDEKANSLKKYNETQNKIQVIERQIEQLKLDQKAEETKLQEAKTKLLKEQEDKIGRSSELKLQKAELERKILVYETEIQKLEAWMKGIEARELNEKADSLYERVTKLSDVRNKLEEDIQSSWHQNRYRKAIVKTAYIGQVMRDDMNDMKNKLEVYRANLIGVIDCLGSEHLD